MIIEQYIKAQVFEPRLKDKGVLVVYDPERRYHSICIQLNGKKTKVIDATEGSIEAREDAQEILLKMSRPKRAVDSLLIYTSATKPQDDEQLQHDPFSLYLACGRVFPDGDGDSFKNLCLKALREHAVEVRKVFASNESPDFSIINQIGGGPGWPQLQSSLGADSASNIIFAFLVPNAIQLEALKEAGETWVSEAKDLFASCLGLKLITKGKTWSTIADELWRYLLFSEFVFDLPEELPEVLQPVPKAADDARQFVEDLCDRLRHDQRTMPEYVRRAEQIETDLNLPTLCAGISDLGKRDTFPFEEKTFLRQAQSALINKDMDRVRTITTEHSNSVWRTKGENEAQWSLIKSASDLMERVEDLRSRFPGDSKDMASLIRFYKSYLREVDRLHREFEQAVEGFLEDDDGIDEVVTAARRSYRVLMDDAQDLYLRFLENEGWPAASLRSNTDTFDRYVAPLLQEKGNRVAMILVDALRYELGLELKRQIADEGQVEIDAVCSVLPSVTPVGMASLLPEAGTKLRLKHEKDSVVPYLGETKVANLQQRMKVLTEKYGQRFQEMKLVDFLKAKKTTIPERIDLLVLRTTELDTQMELSPQMSAPVVSTLARVRMALSRLRSRGFHHVIIATDHGFVLNSTAESGDVCAKPQGDWLMIHDRAVLGTGVSDNNTLVISTQQAGIRGDFDSFGTPRSLAPYKGGLSYFHGGASLQETVIPVVTVKLSTETEGLCKTVSVVLSYRNGATRITTQRPVIEIVAEVNDIFAQQQLVEVLIEAKDSKGRVVGEAKPGGAVNPATGILQLTPGQKVQVPLKMVTMEEFEGKFTIRALNPATMAEYGDGLKLETDYVG